MKARGEDDIPEDAAPADAAPAAGDAGDDEDDAADTAAGDDEKQGSGDPAVYTKKEFVCDAADVTAVSLSSNDFPVRVYPSADDRIRLTYYTHPQDVYTAAVKDGVLTLTHTGRRRVRPTFSFFNSLFTLLSGKNGNVVEEIRLELPAVWAGDVSIASSNGRVAVDDLPALKAVDIRTSNSAVNLNTVSALRVRAATSNGRVTAANVQTVKELNLSSSNGHIGVSGCSAGDEAVLHTSNGSIDIKSLTAAEIDAGTNNSAIRFEDVKAGSYSFNTSNGAVSGMMPGRQEDYDIRSHTSNGRNSLPENAEGNTPLRVRTSNGAVSVTFQEQ
ncbi:MAG: hypothetical protein CW338_08210 [Clostridiales bacterium]|nr:hypothetical protein [Clostridiales bacterium]